MKKTAGMLLIGLFAAVAIQPAASQHRGNRARQDRIARPSLLVEISRDIDAFAEKTELSEGQRAEVLRLLEALDSEQRVAVERIASIHDSLDHVRGPVGPYRGTQQRALVREHQELLRGLRPAAAAFREQLADILTWKQGQSVTREIGSANLRPGPRNSRGMTGRGGPQFRRRGRRG